MTGVTARIMAIVVAAAFSASLAPPARAVTAGNGPRSGIQLSAGGSGTTASATKECFYELPDCTSSYPTVAFGFASDGNSAGCTFHQTVEWGDNTNSTYLFYGSPHNGATLETAEHTYADKPRTYFVIVTGEVTVGSCFALNTTYTFTLTSVPGPAPGCTSSTGACPNCLAAASPAPLSSTNSQSGGSADAAGSTASLFYAGAGTPGVNADEASGTFQVADPKLQTGDCHSLAELAVESQTINGPSRNAVEVGWTVDPYLASLTGGRHPDLPHLFVYYWVNGKGECYDTLCPGFHKIGNLVGSALTVGSKAVLSIGYDGGNWDILDGSDVIGFYPASLWPGFTEFHLAQWFGEVAARPGAGTTCTQMGNGLPGSNPAADTISGMTLHMNGTALPPDIAINDPSPDFYAAAEITATKIRFGGSGACSGP